MNKINVTIEDDNIFIDLGGDLDKACCGCEASRLYELLSSEFGVELKLKKVCCRLPVAERVAAKLRGLCKWKVANPLHVDNALSERRDEK